MHQSTTTLLEDLADFNAHAKRQQRIVGTAEYPSKWDDAHRDLDELLDEWRRGG